MDKIFSIITRADILKISHDCEQPICSKDDQMSPLGSKRNNPNINHQTLQNIFKMASSFSLILMLSSNNKVVLCLILDYSPDMFCSLEARWGQRTFWRSLPPLTSFCPGSVSSSSQSASPGGNLIIVIFLLREKISTLTMTNYFTKRLREQLLDFKDFYLKGLFTNFEYITFFSCLNKGNNF